MKRIVWTMLLVLAGSSMVLAQHDHHPKKDTIPVRKDSISQQHPAKDTVQKKEVIGRSGHNKHDMGSMPSHAFSRTLPMSRNASGTAWNPDASPMYMWLSQTGKTDWMFHGSVFMRYTHTDLFGAGNRGGKRFSFPNWFMVMMNRKLGKRGLLNSTAMISLDRFTETGNGYPLLFQSGETWKGMRLVDRQHPHDLFSSLSVGYTHMLNKDIDLFGYFGYPGEPALGAPAFMHRVSAMNDPDAPLGHHWQDATHITFGVATAGFRYKQFKAEGSVFTGREPDENRYDFDKMRFDSWSYRLSYNPTASWALQFSQGFIHEPEALEPGTDITRTTASVLFAKGISKDRHISTALIWGLNDKGEGHQEHSLLAEGNFQFQKNALFGRYEFIQKSAEELDLEDELGHQAFNVQTFSAGYNRHLFSKGPLELTAGSKITFNFPANNLKPLYGEMPLGFQVYLQIRPLLQKH